MLRLPIIWSKSTTPPPFELLTTYCYEGWERQRGVSSDSISEFHDWRIGGFIQLSHVFHVINPTEKCSCWFYSLWAGVSWALGPIHTGRGTQRACKFECSVDTPIHINRSHLLASPSYGPIHTGHGIPRATRCKQMGPVDVNGGVHTTRKQHQRKNIRICRPRRIPLSVWIGPYNTGPHCQIMAEIYQLDVLFRRTNYTNDEHRRHKICSLP